MAQSIKLWGATYSNVPAVLLPKSTSGTAKFTDVSDTTAAASDVASGKYFYDSSGTRQEGTASGGGGSVSVETTTKQLSAASSSIQFTGLKGTPKYWILRTTTQISSSGSTTYYYVIDARYNGTNTTGNSFRIGSTRRIYNVTTGLSYTYSGGTLTISSNSANNASPGYFYNGTYELVYIY